MYFRHTKHSHLRCNQRGFDPDEIVASLNNPVSKWEDPDQGSIVFTCKLPSGQIIRVPLTIDRNNPNVYIIKSVYDSEAN